MDENWNENSQMVPNVDASFDADSKRSKYTNEIREQNLIEMALKIKAEPMDDMKMKELRLFLCDICL
jgi:hypothetical protein